MTLNQKSRNLLCCSLTDILQAISAYTGMANVKFSDIIKNYESQEVSGEFSIWIAKLELVAELQKIGDKLKFVPLFLSGSAFAVYQQLAEDVKKDYAKLKAALSTAFSSNAFMAYEELQGRALADGESVDVYLADLRRLVGLVGQQNSDPILRCAFVVGLPAEVSVQLKSLANVDDMPLSDIVSKARAMIATRSVSSLLGCAAAPQSVAGTRAKQCFNCKGLGHFARDCPSPRRSSHEAQRPPRRCFKCNSLDHLANKCPQGSGNGKGGVSASDTRPAENQ